MNFALAKVIFHNHEFSFNAIVLLEYADLISNKSLCHFMKISSDPDKILRISKFCGKIITAMIFFLQKIPIQNLFWTELFLIVNRFSNNFLAHFKTH